MKNEESSQFVTGLILGYFDKENPNIYQVIDQNIKDGKINEALAIVLPFMPDGSDGSWNHRIEQAEKYKYIEQSKKYDVWHQEPGNVKSNEEYLSLVLESLAKQYAHQSQIIILQERT